MAKILLLTDSDSLFTKFDSILSDDVCKRATSSSTAELISIVDEVEPEVIICDFQVGTMGAMACSKAIRQEESAGRMPVHMIGLVCDREADTYLAKQSGANAWIIKPLNLLKVQKLLNDLQASNNTSV